MRHLIFVCAVLLTGSCFAPLWAQIDMGGLAGTVKDPTGAVVPAAQLTLTNEATGVAQKTQTSSSGTYVFGAVPAGAYALKVEAPGFKTHVASGIQVHVQNIVTADVSLVLGAVSEVLTVSSASPLLQAQDASLGQTIATRAVNDLPLNGRNWLSLAQLSAGTYIMGSTSTTPSPSGQNFTASIIANGAEPGQVDFRLNGVNNNEEVFGGITVAPVPDAIEEFKIQEGNNSAEFGHSAGAVINAIVKSGTNQVKGNVWEYLRNEDFNANDYFSNLNGLKRQEYRHNQFGGTIGGPVYIPKYYNGKNKTFFFFDYQRTQAVQATTFTDTIPTTLMQSSGFTNLQDLITGNSGTRTDALGRKFPLGTVLDPATTRGLAPGTVDPITGLTNTTNGTVYVRDPFYSGSLRGVTDFTGAVKQLNLIPASRMDPNAIKLLQLLPAPTAPGLQNNYFVAPLYNTTINQYDVKIDHTISTKDTVFGVFSRATTDVTAAQPFPNLAAGGALQIGFATTQPVYLLALSETHIFSPRLINEARIGLNHNYNSRVIPTEDIAGLPAQFGIQGIPDVPHNGGIPTININGFSAFGSRRFSPTLQTTEAQDYTDNVTLIRGSHQFKTGFQYNRVVGDITQPAYSRGNFTWNGQYSDIPNQNSGLVGLADFLLAPGKSSISPSAGVTPYDNLGGPSGYNGSNYAGTGYFSNYVGIYGQDSWKVTANLTLNLGLRWDYFGPFGESDGRQANLVMTDGNGPSGTYYIPQKGCSVPRSSAFNALLAGYNIQVKCGSGLAVGHTQLTNFAPRFGFAYRLRPRLVVRGGYAISYGAFDSVGYGGTLGTNYPFQYTINSPNTTSLVPITLPNGQTATIFNTFGAIPLQDPNQVAGSGLSLAGKQYNYETPYIQSMNLTAQYQFTERDSIQAGYVATAGRHLDTLANHNSPSVILPPGVNQTNYRPFPNLAANSQYLTTSTSSNYRSLQVVYQHQFRGGIDLLANYTYGQCMANDAGKSGLSTAYRAQWLPGFGVSKDYALCTSDATHLVHVSGGYTLPFGKGRPLLRNSSRLVDAVVGGWHLNYIYIYQGGQPFNMSCPVATTSDFGCYANLVAGQDPYAGPHNQTQWLNPSAFAQPPVATQIGQTDYSPLGGHAEQVRGPALSNLDSSIFKRFTISEQTKLEFRAEAFNTFNTAEFGNPGQLNFTNRTGFSRITSLRNNPRLVQLALKLFF